MKITCFGVILLLCLSSRLAWTDNQEPQEDNEGEILVQNELDAQNGDTNNEDDDKMELLNKLDVPNGEINDRGYCFTSSKQCRGRLITVHSYSQCCNRVKGRSFKRRGGWWTKQKCRICRRQG